METPEHDEMDVFAIMDNWRKKVNTTFQMCGS